MSDNLVIGGATFTGVTGIKATDTSDNVITYTSASEAHPYIQVFDYVQATAWSTDSNGNVKNFIDTYCAKGNGIYWIGISQTSTDTYRGVRGFFIRANGTVVTSGGVAMLRGTSNWSITYNTSSSFHIVAGATIRVWYVPTSTALEGMTV